MSEPIRKVTEIERGHYSHGGYVFVDEYEEAGIYHSGDTDFLAEFLPEEARSLRNGKPGRFRITVEFWPEA